ncbi:hypothetical protein A2U01_0096188, partial [Trifolium medium]|nr:hypothetical protein [Trifolium medium]
MISPVMLFFRSGEWEGDLYLQVLRRSSQQE